MPFESGSLKKIDVNTGEIIWQKQIYGRDNEGMDFTDEFAKLEKLTPLFMSKPLVDAKNVVIASHGQPKTTQPFLYSFDKGTGEVVWKERLPTHFNLFAPVKFKGTNFNYYFVNSAIYLEKYGANTGSTYSYGMYLSDKYNAKNRFKNTIYNQMQTDGKSLFIGDERGRFYSLPLDKNANVLNQDINDPNNIFSINTSVFKWVYSDEEFGYVNNGITFLKNNVLFASVEDGLVEQSALSAINTGNGELKWKKVFTGKILHWSLIDDEIFGYTEDKVFRIDASGEDFVEWDLQNKPLSNMEKMNSSNIIYLTQNGIEKFDLQKSIATLVLERDFNDVSVHALNSGWQRIIQWQLDTNWITSKPLVAKGSQKI